MAAVANEDGKGVKIDISDSGSGIAPADRERIFEPFFSGRQNGVKAPDWVWQSFPRSCGTIPAPSTSKPSGGEGTTMTLVFPVAEMLR